MGESTGIAWSDSTWNPWIGCTKVSEGCALCYMYSWERRYGRDPAIVRRAKSTTWNAPVKWERDEAYLEATKKPGELRPPRFVFTCSLSDFFHEAADEWRYEAWEVIRRTPHLTYQILTKRPERIHAHLPADWGKGWPNVWLGVSGETYRHAWDRGKILAQVPAVVRFLSAEPWLETQIAEPSEYLYLLQFFDWVINGGESGPHCRPFSLMTARAMRDAAVLSEVPFFLKQLGGHPDKRAGEKAVLDEQTWTQMPVGRT